jgi:hypothetical protein
MKNKSKSISLIFILLLVISVGSLVTKPTNAQSIPTPAVPEFSVGVANHSYDVPSITTTTTDPYTGKQTTNTQQGYHVENYTIDLTIRNQPFKTNNELVDLFFNIRLKGHYESNWTELYHITNRTNDNNLLRQSVTEFTVKSIPQSFPEHGSIDFQVEAFIAVGHIVVGPFGYWTWQESGWSPTQTITINDTKSSGTFSSSITNIPYPSLSRISTQTPTSAPTSTVPEFSILTILPLLGAILIGTIILRPKKQGELQK